jgi:threonine/homoserine/homoserine lactone efflux protein
MAAIPEPHTLLVFAAAGIVLAVVPGPAVIYIVTRSVRHGRAAGLVSTLGVEVGNLVHVGAAAVGLSALLASSATAFNVVRYAGAGYLAFLPQSVDPAQGAVALRAFVLGSCFVALATVSDSVYALLAGAAGNRLRRGRLLARLSGRVYPGLGAFAALAGERPASD